jgi:hypothetical protein
MQTDRGIHEAARRARAGGGHFRLPRISHAKRVLMWLLLAVLAAFVFDAYLSPNMVFDLANFIFCA